MSLDDPFEQVAWLRRPQLGGWEYLIAHRSRHLWTVYHETYDLCACLRWNHSWRYRGRAHTRSGPGMMLLEPGELHRTLSVPQEAAFKVAVIPVSAVEEAAAELGALGVVHLAHAQSDDPALTNAVLQLGEAVEQGDNTLLELQTMQAVVLQNMLAHAERPPRPANGKDQPSALTRARDYLRDHLYDPVSLDELTAVAGLGRFRLLRAFQRRFGLPPHAYQLQLRIERARALLRRGVLAASVASELGFCDQSHFARHFKRVLGVTPGQYAQCYNSKAG